MIFDNLLFMEKNTSNYIIMQFDEFFRNRVTEV